MPDDSKNVEEIATQVAAQNLAASKTDVNALEEVTKKLTDERNANAKDGDNNELAKVTKKLTDEKSANAEKDGDGGERIL